MLQHLLRDVTGDIANRFVRRFPALGQVRDERVPAVAPTAGRSDVDVVINGTPVATSPALFDLR